MLPVFGVGFLFLPPNFMDKSDAIRLRKQVRSFAQQGLSVSEIARRLGVSRIFVRRWKDIVDPTTDKRGWVTGKKRKYTDAQERQVLDARSDAEKEFFSEHSLSREN